MCPGHNAIGLARGVRRVSGLPVSTCLPAWCVFCVYLSLQLLLLGMVSIIRLQPPLVGIGVARPLSHPASPHLVQLHELHLIHCLGPFRREDLLRPLGWLAEQKAAVGGQQGLAMQGHEAEGHEGQEGQREGLEAAAAAEAEEEEEAPPQQRRRCVRQCVRRRCVRRWAMSDLQLVGGSATELYDDDLLSLLYGRPVGQLAAGGSEVGTGGGGGSARTDGAAGAEHAARIPLPLPLPLPLPPSLPPLRRLRTLALVGVAGLSVGLLGELRRRGTPALSQLRLEQTGYQRPRVGRVQAQAGRGRAAGVVAVEEGSGRGGAAAAAASQVAEAEEGGTQQGQREGEVGDAGRRPFSCEALLGWLTTCGALSNLRLRHCCQVSTGWGG